MGRTARTLGVLALGLLISACASHGPREAGTNPQKNPQRLPSEAQQAPGQAGGDQALSNATAASRNYTPYKWPAPSRDLWARIRAGFQLKPNDQRQEVRVWTQFYATHSGHLQSSLRRARPFLWHVVKQIESRNMPTELALLPVVESGYDPSAKSYCGASGLWQFMPGTAKRMSLSRDWWYDGRDDAIASTHAALDYLQTLNQRYNGNWLLALAAYNAGPGRVDDAIAQARSHGEKATFWNLDLPQETEEYVPRLLALRRIMMTPARFGVDWPKLANKPRTRIVKLPAQTELSVAAKMLGMSTQRLRALNPGMRRWASSPNGHHALLVPSAKAAAFRSKLASTSPSRLIVHRRYTVQRGDVLGGIARTYHVSVASLRQVNHLHGDRIIVGQRLIIPHGGHTAPSQAPARSYVVRAGDTLWGIAKKHGVNVASLEQANRGARHDLHPGQKLTIPGSTASTPKATTYVVRRGDSLWSIAHDHDVSVADLRRWNRLTKGVALHPGRRITLDGAAPLPDYYQVKTGDSLWSIASRFSIQVATLRHLNDMSSDSTIHPGERLRLQPSISS